MIGRTVVLLTCILSIPCIASPNDWDAYIRQIEQADHTTLEALQKRIDHIGDSLNTERSEALTTAISLALIKDPLPVINATETLDQSTDPLKQRFGTSFICSIPGMIHFTQAQTEAYFAKAESALIIAGPAASECLSIMRDTIDEFRQDKRQHPTK